MIRNFSVFILKTLQRSCIYLHIYSYICIYSYTIWIFVQIHVYIYKYMCMVTYVNIYEYIHMWKHMQIHISSFWKNICIHLSRRAFNLSGWQPTDVLCLHCLPTYPAVGAQFWCIKHKYRHLLQRNIFPGIYFTSTTPKPLASPILLLGWIKTFWKEDMIKIFSDLILSPQCLTKFSTKILF